MSSAFRGVAQPASRTLHTNHSDSGYKYADLVSAATTNSATSIGSIYLFPDAAALTEAINDLQSGPNYDVDGYRTHMNGGKKIYWGILGKESNIVSFTLVKITAGENLGSMLYLLSETNMNEIVAYNDTINDALNDVEASAGAQ